MKPLPPHRQQLGKRGESIAADYLQKHGFRLLDRNFKARYGELDIIALDGKTLVFIEVKTRIGRAFGTPEEAVTPRKLREVVLTAQYYKMLHPLLPEAMRIDVIAIELEATGEIVALRHLQSVTE